MRSRVHRSMTDVGVPSGAAAMVALAAWHRAHQLSDCAIAGWSTAGLSVALTSAWISMLAAMAAAVVLSATRAPIGAYLLLTVAVAAAATAGTYLGVADAGCHRWLEDVGGLILTCTVATLIGTAVGFPLGLIGRRPRD